MAAASGGIKQRQTGRYDLSGAIALSCLITVLIAGLIIFFAVKYRSGSKANRDNAPMTNMRLEALWTVIPLVLGLGMFTWAASVYFQRAEVPPNALNVYVVAKQWMWKMQHPDGQREINTLHVPVDRPIRLTMISQDVIHSFYVPDFRVKQDVLPGRYTTLWFEPTEPGTYPLRCAEYCGTGHSVMTGQVIVMPQADYQQWLENGGITSQSSADQGATLFNNLGCVSCHKADNSGRGPSLVGVFGSTVQLSSGASVTANADYIRQSIHQAKISGRCRDTIRSCLPSRGRSMKRDL